MFSRSLMRAARAELSRSMVSSKASPSTTRAIRSASLFTAAIGVGTCPKRRRKQSNVESGEDAYFLDSAVSDSTKIWAGVFDGVGGWADQGVDPAVFSTGLAKHCHSAAKKSPNALPVRVLCDGYEAVQKDIDIQMGSSTACVASVDLNTGETSIANLGDSGYLIVDSAGSVVYASVPQTYFFNAPYQLAKIPASMRRQGSLENKPTDASSTSHSLLPDQFLILATDGFFDNVFPHDAALQVSHLLSANPTTSRQEAVKAISESLTEMARTNGRSRKNGPFAAEAKAHKLRYDGGKEDDICLIVIALEKSRMETKAKL